jgi:hypothetical protein
MYGLSVKIDGKPAPVSVETGYVAIRESVDFFVPSATVVFRDRMSNFVSTYPFMQDTEVELSIDDNLKINKHSFFAFSSNKPQTQKGVEDFEITLDLLSKFADPLLTGSEYHSKKCTASDYIRYIADKCKLKADIEATNEVRSWINPNWKYAQMIRYLAQRSISASGSGGFLYFVQADGTLVFKSIDRLFDDEVGVDVTAGSYKILSEEGLDNMSNKTMVITDNHYANVVLGANNLNVTFYDYRLGKNVTTEVDYSKYLKKRGTVKGVSLGMVKKGNSKFMGTWSSTTNTNPSSLMMPVYNKVLRQFESTQLQLMLPLDNKLKVGGVINLSVPANMDIISTGVNLNYSGRYIIKTMMSVGHGDYMQKLILVRPGISLPLKRKPNYV